MIAVRDPEEHRRNFHMRGLQTLRAPERYLEAIDRIRALIGGGQLGSDLRWTASKLTS